MAEAGLIHAGKLLGDGVAVETLSSLIGESESWVLDGGVANSQQASMLMAKGITPKFVVVLDVDVSTAIAKMDPVVVDPLDQTEYHLENLPPPSEVLDETTGEPIEGVLAPSDRALKRKEQHPAVLHARHNRFNANISSILSLYQAVGCCILRFSQEPEHLLDPLQVAASVMTEIRSLDLLQLTLPPAPQTVSGRSKETKDAPETRTPPPDPEPSDG
eukprot:TRINITY_DN13061_c0_g1_i1.p1 TRINITY_DN13061_c0_g1~~TRINITY_DN13061_c0_g1_i1.p1  ORF type:complete len:217 (-),score=61.19 TRINITY_DN13061_c0_g1_i1:498-1148(-)